MNALETAVIYCFVLFDARGEEMEGPDLHDGEICVRRCVESLLFGRVFDRFNGTKMERWPSG
jgi:hypothetical protein